jgi:RNA polymerase sigma-70 factor, ECF subfamily
MLQSAIVNTNEYTERNPDWAPAEVLQQEWLEIQAAVQDRALFRPLYERHFEQVFRFLFNRTGDEALADDLCSQVFLKAMQKLDSYTFRGVPFSAWLFRIASNEINQHYRNAQNSRVVRAEDSHLDNLAEELDNDDPESRHEALLEAMGQLKPDEMELIRMRFFEERSFKEMSETLDTSEGTIKMRTYLILERMKKNILHPKPKKKDQA